MPGRVNCFVSGCSNARYNNNKQNKTRELSFHRLPRNETLVEKYQTILNSIFPNKKHTRICGAHFKNGKRESRDELPLWQFPPKALSTLKRKAPVVIDR